MSLPKRKRIIKTNESSWLFNNNNNNNNNEIQDEKTKSTLRIVNGHHNHHNQSNHSNHNINHNPNPNHNLNNHDHQQTREISIKTYSSGSLSTDSSSEELSNDESTTTPDSKPIGLTRSASRVSRFKSAKEFFERLSSAQHLNGASQSPVKSLMPTEQRSPRGNIVTRYTANLQTKSTSQASLTSINISLEETSSASSFSSSTDESVICELPGEDILPRGVMFEGDNVIVGKGSLLNKRNKQLKIKFDEADPETFEYPSEGFLLAEPEPNADSNSSKGKYKKSYKILG